MEQNASQKLGFCSGSRAAALCKALAAAGGWSAPFVETMCQAYALCACASRRFSFVVCLCVGSWEVYIPLLDIVDFG